MATQTTPQQLADNDGAIDKSRMKLHQSIDAIAHGMSEQTLAQLFQMLHHRRDAARYAKEPSAHEAGVSLIEQINKSIRDLLYL